MDRVSLRPFEGTVRDAIAEAAAGNSKSQLPMTNNERQDAAWRLTVLTDISKTQVSRKTGISERQVANMRAAAKAVGLSRDDLAEVPWAEARRIWNGQPPREPDDEWQSRMIAKYENQLSKAFAKSLHKNRYLFAEALYNFSESTVEAIIEQYALEHRTRIEYLFQEDDEDVEASDF